MIVLVRSEKSDSLLPGPEHQILVPGKTHKREEKVARGHFPSLKLEFISGDDMGQQHFNLIGRKESSGAVKEQFQVRSKS